LTDDELTRVLSAGGELVDGYAFEINGGVSDWPSRHWAYYSSRDEVYSTPESSDIEPKIDVVDLSRPHPERVNATGAVAVDLSADNPEIPAEARGEAAGKVFVYIRLLDGSRIPVYEELGWRHPGYH